MERERWLRAAWPDFLAIVGAQHRELWQWCQGRRSAQVWQAEAPGRPKLSVPELQRLEVEQLPPARARGLALAPGLEQVRASPRLPLPVRAFDRAVDAGPHGPWQSPPGRHSAEPEPAWELGLEPVRAQAKQSLRAPVRVGQLARSAVVESSGGALRAPWRCLRNRNAEARAPERQLERVAPSYPAFFDGAPPAPYFERCYRFRERPAWSHRRRHKQPAGFSKSAYLPFTSNAPRMQQVNDDYKFEDISVPTA